MFVFDAADSEFSAVQRLHPADRALAGTEVPQAVTFTRRES